MGRVYAHTGRGAVLDDAHNIRGSISPKLSQDSLHCGVANRAPLSNTCTMQELLQRVQSELELRNCALDAASTHFMIVNVSQRNWCIAYVNRAICDSYGYTAAELLGKCPLLLVDATS